MLVNVHHGNKAEHTRLLIAGIIFASLIAGLVWLSIAIYQKKFTPVTMISVQADRAGLQLSAHGDVRVHGVLVGQVRSVENNGSQAVIQVALDPEAAKTIPENISVNILPTTLFGRKFLSLVDPKVPSEQMIQNGAVIPASRVTTNVELQRIMANLFPILRSVRPADLNNTLHAISHALTGNGDRIGQTLTDLDKYLTTINKHMPTVKTDLKLLAKVAGNYSKAAPEMMEILRNVTVTAKTIAAKQKTLPLFMRQIIGLSQTSRQVLSENEVGIIRAAQLANPLTALFDKYSPQTACLMRSLDKATDGLAAVFHHGRVNQSMDFEAPQRRAYRYNLDKPAFKDKRGPVCLTRADAFKSNPLLNGSPLDGDNE